MSQRTESGAGEGREGPTSPARRGRIVAPLWDLTAALRGQRMSRHERYASAALLESRSREKCSYAEGFNEHCNQSPGAEFRGNCA
jgi:hypothetical protein